MPKTILVAEDDPLMGAMLRSRYEAKGYRVVVAPDGLQLGLMARDLKPDLIISDLQMPGAGGDLAYKRLLTSTETAAIPTVFLTGLPKEEAVRRVSMFFRTRLFHKSEPLEKLDAAVADLIGGPA